MNLLDFKKDESYIFKNSLQDHLTFVIKGTVQQLYMEGWGSGGGVHYLFFYILSCVLTRYLYLIICFEDPQLPLPISLSLVFSVIGHMILLNHGTYNGW